MYTNVKQRVYGGRRIESGLPVRRGKFDSHHVIGIQRDVAFSWKHTVYLGNIMAVSFLPPLSFSFSSLSSPFFLLEWILMLTRYSTRVRKSKYGTARGTVRFLVFRRAVYSKRVSEQSAINYPSRKCKYSSINLGENYVAVVFFAARGEGINLPRRGLGSGLRGEQFSNYNRSFEVR